MRKPSRKLNRELISALLFLLLAPAAALANCPLQKEIGQLFVVAIPDGTSPDDFVAYAKEKNIGGVMLFNWNLNDIHEPNDLIDLTNKLQEGREPGMFVAVDQEGGLIQRFNQSRGFTMLPSAMRVGGTGDERYAREIGRIAGEELKAVGVNWNFAPSVDVATNPDNPVVARIKRSYSADPKVVGQMASQMILGMNEKGLITTAKHFPGHGDTVGDSHAGMVSIHKPWEEIVRTELVPFVEAINHGVTSIMVGHINVDCLSDLPASLNPLLLQGELRGEMEFEGLIVTDDLSMGAVTDKYSLGEAAEMAVRAGNDVLLANFGSEREMIDHLCKASQESGPSGDELRARIRESYERILGVKKKFGIEKPAKIPRLAKRLSTREHQELSARVFELTGGLPAGTQGPLLDKDASEGLKNLVGAGN